MLPVETIAEMAWTLTITEAPGIMDLGGKPDDLAAVLAVAAYLCREQCTHPDTRARVEKTVANALAYAKAKLDGEDTK